MHYFIHIIIFGKLSNIMCITGTISKLLGNNLFEHLKNKKMKIIYKEIMDLHYYLPATVNG